MAMMAVKLNNKYKYYWIPTIFLFNIIISNTLRQVNNKITFYSLVHHKHTIFTLLLILLHTNNGFLKNIKANPSKKESEK